MSKSRYLAMLCVVLLISAVVGCDDDDDVVQARLNTSTVAAGLEEAIPPAVDVPVALIDLFLSLAPLAAQSGSLAAQQQTCTPIPDPENPQSPLCVQGTGEACDNTAGEFSQVDWIFDGCVDAEGTQIEGDVRSTWSTGGTSIVFDFGQGDPFSVDGTPINGQISIEAFSVVQFVNVDTSIDGADLEINGGPLTINTEISPSTVNGSFNLTVDLSGLPPFSGPVSFVNNAITALMTDASTSPPTFYSCTGTLSTELDTTADLDCVQVEEF